MNKIRLSKYLKGTAKVLKELAKEIDTLGIDSKSLDLMKKIGSDLLFRGCSIDFQEEINQDKSELKREPTSRRRITR